jgi:hypothetical protein
VLRVVDGTGSLVHSTALREREFRLMEWREIASAPPIGLAFAGDTLIVAYPLPSRGSRGSGVLLEAMVDDEVVARRAWASAVPHMDFRLLGARRTDRIMVRAQLLGLALDPLRRPHFELHILDMHSGRAPKWRPFPGLQTAPFSSPNIAYTSADTLLSIDAGREAALFASSPMIATAGDHVYLARDSSPVIEVYSSRGRPVESIVLDVERVPAVGAAVARRMSYRRAYERMNAATLAVLQANPAHLVQPVIRSMLASPDGMLLIARADIGWDHPPEEQRVFFDVFDRQMRHVGSGSVAAHERIVSFAPPLLCTSMEQHEPFPKPPADFRSFSHGAERQLVTCYRVQGLPDSPDG